MSDFDDYEDYCEEYRDSNIELMSKEEFEARRDKDKYILETKDGNFFAESVPLIYKL